MDFAKTAQLIRDHLDKTAQDPRLYGALNRLKAGMGMLPAAPIKTVLTQPSILPRGQQIARNASFQGFQDLGGRGKQIAESLYGPTASGQELARYGRL